MPSTYDIAIENRQTIRAILDRLLKVEQHVGLAPGPQGGRKKRRKTKRKKRKRRRTKGKRRQRKRRKTRKRKK